jgi:hypothetical protein
MNITNYEAPHYSVFSHFLLPPLSTFRYPSATDTRELLLCASHCRAAYCEPKTSSPPFAGNMAYIVTMCNNRRNAYSRRAFLFTACRFSNCRPQCGLEVAVFHMIQSRLTLEFKCVSRLSIHMHWSIIGRIRPSYVLYRPF